jgi:hypothetical protein
LPLLDGLVLKFPQKFRLQYSKDYLSTLGTKVMLIPQTIVSASLKSFLGFDVQIKSDFTLDSGDKPLFE